MNTNFARVRNGRRTRIIVALVCVALWTSTSTRAAELEEVVDAAIAGDPVIAGTIAEERAWREASVAAAELPDPRVQVNLANVPTDTFDLAQEPMTQVAIGVSQSFPPGETRRLRSERMVLRGEVVPAQRALRRATIKREVSLRWYDAMLAERSIQLVRAERPFFEQLIDVTQSLYTSGARNAGQKDVIAASAELTRLDNRLLMAREVRARKLSELTQWVPAMSIATVPWAATSDTQVSWNAPDLAMHPESRVSERMVRIANADVELAREQRKPGWSLNTSYGIRDHDRFGNDLADFVSVGVAFDLPLFRANRQDRQVRAASERVAVAENTRLEKLRVLRAGLAEARTRVDELSAQRALYRDTLMTQLDSLTSASLDAYTARTGDFNDVLRAYVSRLNARIELARIETEMHKALVLIEYYMTTDDEGVSQ
ncbi:MAG: TolC family protein [Pseudomonadales bacterium]|nr:TolC family protein [Pseudomonadales bacterium]